MLAAAAGLLGLLALGPHRAARPSLSRLIAAGALIGAAADVKANYILFGLGAAWVLRRWPAALATAAGLVALCLTGNWKLREPGEPPGAGPGVPGAAGDPGDATLARPATG